MSAAAAQRESVFAVDDMFCGGCAATVERAVRRLPGVNDVNVSFLGDTAVVLHDATIIDDAGIRRAIARLGYTTRATNDSQAASRTSHFERQLRMRLGVAIGFGLWVMMASMVRLFIGVPTPTLAWSIAVFSGVVSLPVLLYSAAPFLKLGALGLRERVPGMDSLILIATVAAVTGSLITLADGGSHVWFDVPVMLVIFQLLARLADFGAHRKAANAVRALLDLSPVQARRVLADKRIEMVPLVQLGVGDLIQSHAGERICMDGVIQAGAAYVDTGLLNGESVPEHKRKGDAVHAGTLNMDGVLTVCVDAPMGKRRMDVLAASVGRLLNKKTHLMKLADGVAFWLVPVLIAVAVAVSVVLLVGGSSLAHALERALTVLVVSCPCALSLAVPLVVSVTAAKAAREGIVLRDASALDKAARLDTVLIDKTGTLTVGKPQVVEVHASIGLSDAEVLAMAASAGYGSHHPLMLAITETAKSEADSGLATTAQRREHPGKGVECQFANGDCVLAGSRQWLAAAGISEQGISESAVSESVVAPSVPIRTRHASEVCVARNGQWCGCVFLADKLRDDARTLIVALQRQGKLIMLVSGDRTGSVRAVADQLGIEWQAEVSPEGKAALVQRLSDEGRVVAFVGDGLNDGPALAAAAVGIATGKASDLARSASALAILDGGLDRVVLALSLSGKASSVLKSNIGWALLYNALLLPVAVLGWVHPLMAVVAMGLSTLSVSLNSLRAGAISLKTLHA